MISLKSVSVKQLCQFAVIATIGVLYTGLNYWASVAEHPPLLMVAFSMIPLAVLALATAWHSKFKLFLLPLCCFSIAAFAWYFETLQQHVAWLYFIQHGGAMILLGIMFGSTLDTDETALCSRIASFITPEPLDAQYLHYTWQVTLAWTIFFAASAIISVLLFAFAAIEVWSIFANVLTPVLLGVMFVGEYLIRVRLMPNRPHFSIAKTISAYREYSKQQNTR